MRQVWREIKCSKCGTGLKLQASVPVKFALCDKFCKGKPARTGKTENR